MIISLLISLAPVIVRFALSILESVVMKNKSDADAVAAWLKIIDTVRASGLISNDLHNKYAAQLAKAEDRADEEWKKRNQPKDTVKK